MDRIFLCENEETVGRVYGAELMAELGADGRVWDKKSLLAEPERFAQVEYVFSTWGMPELTEDEIRRCLPCLHREQEVQRQVCRDQGSSHT